MEDGDKSRAIKHVGRVGELPLRAAVSGAEMFDRWRLRLAGFLESTGSVDKALEKWGDLIAADDEFVAWFEHVSMHAWMAGQLMVRAVELGGDAGAPGTVTFAIDPNSFVNQSFAEAEAFFAAKQVVSPQAFAATQGRFRRGAFVARNLASGALQTAARARVAAVVAGGESVQGAAALIRADALALGISPANPGYVTTVVRTNVSTSYNAGRYSAMADPAVKALRPFWKYVTAKDDRVRDDHAALEGNLYEADSAEGNAYYPPLGFNCRCQMVSQSARQASATGTPVERGPSTDSDGNTILPDQGFEAPPQPLT
jgi:SPP1 gp7 family putative phage head morphogenesis protein